MTPTRNEHFVPLNAAAPLPLSDRREFRATVISATGEAQAFQSAAGATMTSSTTNPAHQAQCEPKVSLQRDGNRVTGIQVQCSCGQVIELSCVYEAPAAPAIVTAQPATIPQPEPVAAPAEPAPGKICKESGKDLPKTNAKAAKAAEKGRGTPAAKRRSA
jgi:hypothetical protein